MTITMLDGDIDDNGCGDGDDGDDHDNGDDQDSAEEHADSDAKEGVAAFHEKREAKFNDWLES